MIDFKHHTPVEKYKIKNHEVFVKREDKYLFEYQNQGCPALSKLRGASFLLMKLKEQGIRNIGVFDTKISKAGQGISFLCREIGLKCCLGFPLPKGEEIAESKLVAEKNGAKLIPLVAGRTNICYYRFKKQITEAGGYMLPLGLVCRETVDAVKQEALDSFSGSDSIHPGVVVLSTGTGTIASGVALGSNAKVVGVSCGMDTKLQRKRINSISYPDAIWNLELIPPQFEYYDKLKTENIPFPTNPWYDAKAWHWLEENIERLNPPVVFWNIGI